MDNSFEAYKQHSFDCFCKRLPKNEMRNYYNEIKRRRKHEGSFSELTAKELEQLSACDNYFADGQYIFNVLGNDVNRQTVKFGTLYRLIQTDKHTQRTKKTYGGKRQ